MAQQPWVGGTPGTPSKHGGMVAEGPVSGGQQQPQRLQQQSREEVANLHLADLDPESARAAIQRLFDASVELEDPEFHVVGPLCKLSLEMVSMQSGTHVGWSPD